MKQVIQATRFVGICDVCKKRICAGEVYVALFSLGNTGQMTWQYRHIWCDAYKRGARWERL